jgi:ADP-ribosylglycohydrolase
VIGCVLGGALGDALGYPVEFARSTGEIERVLGPGAPARLLRAAHGKALVSDDMQMTLFTAEGLIRARHRSIDRGNCSTSAVLLGAYQRWLSTQTGDDPERWRDRLQRGWLLDVRELHAQRAPGRTCLSALARSLDLGVATVDSPPNDSKGCGAVMRSAPIGLVAEDAEEAFRTARDAAVLTHGHPSGYLAAAHFAAVIHEVVRDVPLAKAISTANDLLGREHRAAEVRRAVDRACALAFEGDVSPAIIGQLGEGWVAEEALAIGLFCALTAKDRTPSATAEALRSSVAHPGDSDSTGSITGNLLGAMGGTEALPADWLVDLELHDVIESVGRDLHETFVLDLVPRWVAYPPC